MDEQAGAERNSGESAGGYQPPRVEWVLTPAELEREVLYAGTDNSIDF